MEERRVNVANMIQYRLSVCVDTSFGQFAAMAFCVLIVSVL